VSTNSYQLSSLTPSTTYVVHVKSVCGNEGESEWSQNQIFSTSSASAGLTVVTLQPTDIAENSATLNGEISNPDNQSITSCGFEWKATGSGSYSSAMISISNVMSYTLNGLLPNTSYTYRAFVITAGGNHYGEEVTFSTAAEQCPSPINVNQLGVTDNSLMVVWTNLAPASEWEIRYRPEGGDWLTVTVTNVTYFNLANLASGTTYEVQVRAICDEEHSSNWSASAFFTTNSLDDYLMGKIALYPNPAKAYVDVRFSDNDINMTDIEVYDVYGKLLYMTAVSDNPTRIDVSQLASGLYFVKVITDKGTATKTFVKQ
jgi:subtilisin